MTALLVLFTTISAALMWLKVCQSRRRNPDMFKKCHIVITGGSQGLGYAIAGKLKKDAKRITIWARGESQLKKAVQQLSMDTNAKIDMKMVDVCKYEQVKKAAEEDDEAPDVVFCCAGASRPGWFLKQSLQDFYDGMQLNYFGALHTARIYAQRMVEEGKKGRIVFISSTVGLMGMVGYAQYSPTKYALRGLAECLNQEFLKDGITFHIYFVASIKTVGYENEQKTKPEITKLLEGKDVSGDQSAEGRASTLIDGLMNNQIFVTSDFFTRLLLATSEGFNLRLKEVPWALAGWLILPLVRIYFKNAIWHSKAKAD